ncbi:MULTISPECIES: carbamoyltransferase HypF [Rhodopseudomonas]|uniref:Carbamoyltransferase HypF n=1 Tax=Rhodopseudomonas palustris TaxID=1076 RepID=A0A0D7EXI0_RHOPL|nr:MULTISPECIES: carbamoyltransferase HypF [Rhodopseudomonas]KIZ45523.1 carbamoyltransferase [Rhodopseudomonas palustris]MDF3809521.1 carbamoyltransferase HypF [Rhodopseudomonas sp. BAL398]WOK19723.1 carbamoyltransferase HypF [Rhodopseudomonas sp. BAL398]
MTDRPISAAAEAIRVRGVVQGVGFRPFIYALAHRLGLVGEVHNDDEGVLIHVAGSRHAIDALAAAITEECPPLAQVSAVERAPWSPPAGLTLFSIAASPASRGQHTAGVVPDARICAACAAEIDSAGERRHRYAFASCTTCGPRFSILEAIPYDRATTTMSGFAMCPDCRREYDSPADRRFHAQPIACPVCGPRLWLQRAADELLPAADPLAAAVAALRQGQIVGLKGLGGFHLACDAGNEIAVAALRQRKRRPAKPFALMAPDLNAIRRFCFVDATEAALLASPAAPIVLLLRQPAAGLAPAVAPNQNLLGFMLPTTPLHHLLLREFGGALVMTSGNVSGEPQVISNDEAQAKLGGFADLFVMHDRPIARRLDDSVARVVRGEARLLRHARGYAPAPRSLPPGFADAPAVLALGGEMKAAICLLRGNEALLSHHLGDLEEPLTYGEFVRAIGDYAQLFDHRPAALAADLHPAYRSTHWAEAAAAAHNLPLIQVQHHHAHIAAAMAERHWPRDGGRVVGIALDGVGFGADGTVWGGEILLCDYTNFTRMACLQPVPLPGGARAVTEPWRNLLAQLDGAFGVDGTMARLPHLPGGAILAAQPLGVLRQAMAQGLNAPLSSSCGRLFDAVAAALDLAPVRLSFEGEAAMALEALAGPSDDTQCYPFKLATATDPWIIDPAPMWTALLADLADGVPTATIAARFHHGLAAAFCDTALRIARDHDAKAIALGGGVFQNGMLLQACLTRLGQAALPVLAPAQIPANDGGLAFGQAIIAAARVTN